MKNRETGRAKAGTKPAHSRAPVAASLISISPPLAAAVAVVAAVLVYLPALRNGFIWDDPLVLQQLRAIRTWGDLVVMPPVIPRFYYRPFIFVSYLIDRSLGGEAPFWFHASVIAVHALNCLLVFILASRLFPGDVLTAGASAIVFAVYPTHVESVAWMAGRSDVIVCCFLLVTVLLFMQRALWWTAWLGAVVFLLALLSKEMALAGVVVVPLLDLLGARRLYWTRYAPLLVASVLYFALRQHSGGAFVGGTAVNVAPGQMLGDLVRAVGFYAIHAVVPVQLCAYVPHVPEGGLYMGASLMLGLASIGILIMAWRWQLWPLAYLVLWFFLTLAPSLTVIVRRSASAVVADRYLYVPSVATCMLAAWAVGQLAQRQRRVIWPLAILAVLSIGFAVQAATYTRVWTDNFTFWSDVAAKVPNAALAQRELALALLDRGQLDDAERTLQRTLALPSDDESRAMAYGNLGNIYRRKGRFTDAVQALESALAIAPHPGLYHDLGMALMAKVESEKHQSDQAALISDIQRARVAFETALKLKDAPGGQAFLEQWNPAKTHALLGQVLFTLGDRAAAREHLETALRLEPTGPVAEATRRYLELFHP